jgi:hypothetical protein
MFVARGGRSDSPVVRAGSTGASALGGQGASSPSLASTSWARPPGIRGKVSRGRHLFASDDERVAGLNA